MTDIIFIRRGGMAALAGGAEGLRRVAAWGMHPHFLFGCAEKKTGRARSKRKGALRPEIFPHGKISGLNAGAVRIGIGINLNQAVFRGDAPNPVSLFQIIGKEVDREEVLDRFLSVFYRYYLSLLQEEYEDIRIRYQSALYRREGYHAYRDEAGEFEACIHDIESTGHLLLVLRDGSIRRYAFKEVSYCK